MAAIDDLRFRIQFHIEATEKACRSSMRAMLLFKYGVPLLSFLLTIVAGGGFGTQKGVAIGLASIVTALTTLHSAINPSKRFALASHYNNLFNTKKIALDADLEAGKHPSDLVAAMNGEVSKLIQGYNERQSSDLAAIKTEGHRGEETFLHPGRKKDASDS